MRRRRVETIKAHLTERGVTGLEPGPKNIIVYDEEVVGFGVRVTSGGTRAFIPAYRIEARERRLTIGAWPDWPVTAARESPNVRQLIGRYLSTHEIRRLSAALDAHPKRRAAAHDPAACAGGLQMGVSG